MHYIKMDNGLWCSFNPETFEIRIVREKTSVEANQGDTICINQQRFDIKPETNAIHTLLIAVAEVCNMNCAYCYAGGGNYGNKEKIMGAHNAAEYIKKYKKFFASGISVVFFGGEPLLASNTIQTIIDVLKEEDISADYSVVTNGTLLFGNRLDLITKNHIKTTISLDGPKEFNDSYRKMRDGSSAYDSVAGNLKPLHDANIPVTAEATCAANYFSQYHQGDYSKFISTYEKLGFSNLVVGVAIQKDTYSEKALHGIEMFYQDMVEHTFNILLQHNSSHFLIPYNLLEMLMYIVRKRHVSRCSAGQTYAFMNSKGDIYPCQIYYASHTTKMNRTGKHLDFISASKDTSTMEQCATCFCKNLCLAWCPGASLAYNGTEYGIIPERCAAQKALTENILRQLATLYLDSEKWKVFVKNFEDYIKSLQHHYHR